MNEWPKYFTNPKGFQDSTQYIVFYSEDNCKAIKKDDSVSISWITLKWANFFVAQGIWKQIFIDKKLSNWQKVDW